MEAAALEAVVEASTAVSVTNPLMVLLGICIVLSVVLYSGRQHGLLFVSVVVVQRAVIKLLLLDLSRRSLVLTLPIRLII